MKANELMIDDWVLFNGSPYHILNLKRNGVINLYDTVLERIYKIELNTDFIEEFIEPILLTPEILEKNGFERYESFDPEIEIVAYKSPDKRIYLKTGLSNKKWFCTFRSEGGLMEILMIGINYVHELQHALRLCGIEKEIVL